MASSEAASAARPSVPPSLSVALGGSRASRPCHHLLLGGTRRRRLASFPRSLVQHVRAPRQVIGDELKLRHRNVSGDGSVTKWECVGHVVKLTAAEEALNPKP